MLVEESRITVTERERLSPGLDFAVIRPQPNYKRESLATLISALEERNIQTLLVSQLEHNYYKPTGNRWYPTDAFREVGPYILVNNEEQWESVINFLAKSLPERKIDDLRNRTRSIFLKGGDLISNDAHQTFIYPFDQLYESYSYETDDRKKRNKAMELGRNVLVQELMSQSWKVIPVATKGIRLPNEPHDQQDLDFLLSLFSGTDGKLHAIVAESFSSAVTPDWQVIPHSIPDHEASLGGCNIADIRHGQVLVAPNPSVAPVANEILKKYAKAEVISVPQHLLSGGGGPRCSISSISL